MAATRLPTDAATNTLVDSDTASYRATQEVRRDFGEEPVVVLAEGDLQRIVLTANLGRLLRLEGCLSGKVPKGAKPIPGPCTELAEQDPVRSLVGPATFLNEATIQVQRELERLVATVPPDKLRELLLQIAARYGITSAPSLSNPDFLAAIVFDIDKARGTPKAKLAYLFPNGHSAQIILRLRSDLSASERHRAIETIRAVVHDPVARGQCKFKGKPERCFQLHGAKYVISGVPVVVDAVTRALKDALLVLLGVALVVMAVTLLLVFRSRWRLLPLGIALAAAALTFGDLRPARRLADDGLDRRPADPDRPRGGLRDSASGEVRRGGCPGSLSGSRRRSPRCFGWRPSDCNRLPGHWRRLPGASAFPDPDGSWLRMAARSGNRDRFSAGFHRRVRGPSVSGENPATGGTPGDPVPGAAPVGGGSRSPPEGSGRWPGTGRDRLGPRDPDRNADRHSKAGAAERGSR